MRAEFPDEVGIGNDAELRVAAEEQGVVCVHERVVRRDQQFFVVANCRCHISQFLYPLRCALLKLSNQVRSVMPCNYIEQVLSFFYSDGTNPLLVTFEMLPTAGKQHNEITLWHLFGSSADVDLGMHKLVELCVRIKIVRDYDLSALVDHAVACKRLDG